MADVLEFLTRWHALINACLLLCLFWSMADRVRGGGYNVGGTFRSRVWFGLCIGTGFSVLLPEFWAWAPYFAVAAILSMALVAHKSGMVMGLDRRDYGYDGISFPWFRFIGPAGGRRIQYREVRFNFPLPKLKADDPLWKYVACYTADYLLVGGLRGVIVFTIPGIFASPFFFIGIPVMALMRPLAYAVGQWKGWPAQYVAWKDADGKLHANDQDPVQNSEMLDGVGWAASFIAVALALTLSFDPRPLGAQIYGPPDPTPAFDPDAARK